MSKLPSDSQQGTTSDSALTTQAVAGSRGDRQGVTWLLQPMERFKPWIGVLDHPCRSRVLKDYSPKPWYCRSLFGAYALHREAKMYRKLSGINGIPDFHGFQGKSAIVLEYIPGTVLSAYKKKEIPRIFFESLEQLVAEMHKRGVVHGDLRLKNILVTEDMKPYLIDFATAFTYSENSFAPWRWFCRYMRKVDRRVLAKLKAKLAPQWLSDTDRQLLSERMILLNSGRHLRKTLAKWYKGKGRRGRKEK